MEKIKRFIKEKFVRKNLWINKKTAKDLEVEAKNNWSNNQSALLRHILTKWFK